MIFWIRLYCSIRIRCLVFTEYTHPHLCQPDGFLGLGMGTISLNSSKFRPAPQRRGAETGLAGGEGGITRAKRSPLQGHRRFATTLSRTAAQCSARTNSFLISTSPSPAPTVKERLKKWRFFIMAVGAVCCTIVSADFPDRRENTGKIRAFLTFRRPPLSIIFCFNWKIPYSRPVSEIRNRELAGKSSNNHFGF